MVAAVVAAVALLGLVATTAAAQHSSVDDPVGQAFYILFENQMEGSSFPSAYKQYSHFITCPQNITASQLSAARAAVPGSKYLAYWDFGDVPLKVEGSCSKGHVMGDRPGRNCTTSYKCGAGSWTKGIAASSIKPSYLIHELYPNGTSSVVCLYPGLASYVWFEELADAAVEFLASWLKSVPFDGVYLDGFVNDALFAAGRATELKAMAAVDVNGDGKADTYEEIVAQYAAFAPYFVAKLRAALGPDALFLANSAGSLSSPSLNGITVEMESCVDEEACMAAIRGQYGVSVKPATTIMWLTHSEVMPAKEQCERVAAMHKELPWILAGTDFFDGSHVVCNFTAPATATRAEELK